MSINTDYTLTVSTGTTTGNNLYVGDYHYCSTLCNHYGWTWYPYTTWSTPVTIYKYQVKCPKCKTNNWLELDTITPCSKCSSTLKAVTKSVDYEVEVD